MTRERHRTFSPAALIALGLAFFAVFLAGCRQEQKVAIQPEPSIEAALKPVHPDEPAETTFKQRFSLDNALARVGQIRESSTATGEGAMAMSNWTGAIEGTLMKQDYLAKKADFELAKYQFRDKEIAKEEYDKREAAFRKAEADFKTFWEDFGISD